MNNDKVPCLAIYHANATNTGSAVKFELHPASNESEGSILARFAAQKTVADRSKEQLIYPTFDWDGEISVRLDFNDICKIIQVFRGECESIDDGKGLYHISAEHSTKVALRHVIEPLNSYSFEAYRAYRDGREDATARIMLTSAEAMGLCCALENSMAAICFGDGCNAPVLSKTPGNDNSVAKLRGAVKCLMDNLNIHLVLPSEQITLNRAELDGMVMVCEKALAAPHEEGDDK